MRHKSRKEDQKSTLLATVKHCAEMLQLLQWLSDFCALTSTLGQLIIGVEPHQKFPHRSSCGANCIEINMRHCHYINEVFDAAP